LTGFASHFIFSRKKPMMWRLAAFGHHPDIADRSLSKQWTKAQF
jgi:hypothetical protein